MQAADVNYIRPAIVYILTFEPSPLARGPAPSPPTSMMSTRTVVFEGVKEIQQRRFVTTNK